MAVVAQRSIRSGVRAQASRRGAVRVQASTRPLWCPGAKVPAHLNGTLAGDFGFDPLNLGADSESLRWYTQAELIHCRTAMAAVAGILIPSILTKAGVLNVPEWFEAGKAYLQGKDAIAFGPLVVAMHYLYGFVEIKRWVDFNKPGSQTEPGSFLGFEPSFKAVECSYPGGAFDPLGLSRQGKEVYESFKLREVKNGRLAMLAFMGFVAQYYATGKGPIDNLVDHVKDPFHVNFAENGVSLPGCVPFCTPF